MRKAFELLMEHSGKIQNSLSMIVKLLIIVSLFHAVYFHLWQILFADLFLLLLLMLPYFLRKNYEVSIPKELELGILTFVVVSFFLGEIRGIVIQTFFGIAVGFAGFVIMLLLFSNSSLRTNYLLIVVYSFSIALALGLSAEMLKFYLKMYLGYSFSGADYSYAMFSLSFVALGALSSALVGYLYMKGYRTSILKGLVGRFKSKNPNFFIERSDSPEEVLSLIKKGENEKLEFKSTLRTNLHINEHDKKVENSALKTLVAFLNSEGGTLLIGINDAGEILGIEKDGFENNDKFLRHFTNLVKERIGNEFLPYISSELVLIEGKYLFKVSCKKSDKPVFLKFDGAEEFYIRLGASSLLIFGSKMLEYIKNKFEK